MVTTLDARELDAGKSAEQLCAEKLKRAQDAVQLRQPDRIPIVVRFGGLLAEMAGITRKELYEDPDKADQAVAAAALCFQPDFIGGAGSNPGMSRILGDRMTKWPGYGLGENQPFQYQEQEFMRADEYDAFLDDPADWAIRTYLPRVFSELEGLAQLPHLGLTSLGYFFLSGNIANLASPPIAKSIQALLAAAEFQAKVSKRSAQSRRRLAELGFPGAQFLAGGGGGRSASAPFDYMSDTLRGMRGIFLDMRRCPEKLLAAEEKVIGIQLRECIGGSRAKTQAGEFAGCWLALHRGSDGFISIRDFERFYWPQLKRLLLGLIDAGITPTVYYEGCWDQRLNYLAELPRGKSIGLFQQSDIFKVKRVLGDTMCIVGGMKVSMLSLGGSTVEEIRTYTKRLCEEVGEGGGFIMSTDIGEMEGCDPGLIKVWVDTTREFGRYQ